MVREVCRYKRATRLQCNRDHSRMDVWQPKQRLSWPPGSVALHLSLASV